MGRRAAQQTVWRQSDGTAVNLNNRDLALIGRTCEQIFRTEFFARASFLSSSNANVHVCFTSISVTSIICQEWMMVSMSYSHCCFSPSIHQLQAIQRDWQESECTLWAVLLLIWHTLDWGWSSCHSNSLWRLTILKVQMKPPGIVDWSMVHGQSTSVTGPHWAGGWNNIPCSDSVNTFLAGNAS